MPGIKFVEERKRVIQALHKKYENGQGCYKVLLSSNNILSRMRPSTFQALRNNAT